MKKLHQLVALFALLLSLVFFGGCANGPQVDPQITATVAIKAWLNAAMPEKTVVA